MTRGPAPRPDGVDDLTNLLLAGLGILLALAARPAGRGVGVRDRSPGTPRRPAASPAPSGVLAHPGDPSAAWGTPMPGPVVYWAVTAVLLLAVAGALIAVVSWWRRDTHHRRADPRRLPGTATRADVVAAAGTKAVVRRAAHTRPNLAKPAEVRPGEVGYLLGRSHGVNAWASVEDSMLLLGPPALRQGPARRHPVHPRRPRRRRHHLHPARQPHRHHDAPARPWARWRCSTPSTSPPASRDGLRWSPVRGCETPQTAMIRARGLAAGTGMSKGGVEGGDFWQAQTETVLRCLLHAAALDGRTAADLYRWSLDPAAAVEAVTILGRDTTAAPGWEDALEQAADADPRTRDSIWLGVRQALSALADPQSPGHRHPQGRRESSTRPRSSPHGAPSTSSAPRPAPAPPHPCSRRWWRTWSKPPAAWPPPRPGPVSTRRCCWRWTRSATSPPCRRCRR